MRPQYVWNRDSPSLGGGYAKQFSCIITDPPYRDHVHGNAVSQSQGRGVRKRDLGFESLSRRDRQALANWAANVQRWSVVYSDVENSTLLRWAVQARGIEYIRTLAWVRWSMPQLSGTIPPSGLEHILLFHSKGKKHWNGPGNLIGLHHKALRGEGKHKTEKPLDQALDLVSWFTDIGECVFDPYAGSGTVGLACRLLGRRYTGFEIGFEWSYLANQRLLKPLSARDEERVKRWLENDLEPVSSQLSGPSTIRAESRAFDKENVRKGVFL